MGQEDPLEEEMAIHSGILAWKIPWTEKPGGPQSTGVARVGHDLATKQQQSDFYCGHNGKGREEREEKHQPRKS